MSSPAPSPVQDHREFLLRWFWHEGDNLNQRTDWFLIFHAILMEAYLAAGGDHGLPSRGLEIGLLGLVTSALWLAIGVRNEWHIKYLIEGVKQPELISSEVAHVLRALLDARDQQPRWVKRFHSVPIFGKIVPFCCLAAWLVLVLQRWLTWPWVSLGLLSLIPFGIALISLRPQFTSELLARIIPAPSQGPSNNQMQCS